MNAARATIERLNKTSAIVELNANDGAWLGCQLITCRSGADDDLYEHGYNAAAVSAKAHGYTLGRYSWA